MSVVFVQWQSWKSLQNIVYLLLVSYPIKEKYLLLKTVFCEWIVNKIKSVAYCPADWYPFLNVYVKGVLFVVYSMISSVWNIEELDVDTVNIHAEIIKDNEMSILDQRNGNNNNFNVNEKQYCWMQLEWVFWLLCICKWFSMHILTELSSYKLT